MEGSFKKLWGWDSDNNTWRKIKVNSSGEILMSLANHDYTIHDFIGAKAYASAAQDNLAAGSWTKVVLGTEVYDNGGYFSSNGWTAPQDLKVHVDALIGFTDVAGGAYYFGAIYINTTAKHIVKVHSVSGADLGIQLSTDLLLLQGEKVYLYVNPVAPNSDIVTGEAYTSMSIHALGV